MYYQIFSRLPTRVYIPIKSGVLGPVCVETSTCKFARVSAEKPSMPIRYYWHFSITY